MHKLICNIENELRCYEDIKLQPNMLDCLHKLTSIYLELISSEKIKKDDINIKINDSKKE